MYLILRKGNAHFVSGSYLPNLQLEAETNVSNYNIMLGVKGTVDHMDLSLSSNPSLSRKQIISMLTFGRGADSKSRTLRNEDVNAVATAGLTNVCLLAMYKMHYKIHLG